MPHVQVARPANFLFLTGMNTYSTDCAPSPADTQYHYRDAALEAASLRLHAIGRRRCFFLFVFRNYMRYTGRVLRSSRERWWPI